MSANFFFFGDSLPVWVKLNLKLNHFSWGISLRVVVYFKHSDSLLKSSLVILPKKAEAAHGKVSGRTGQTGRSCRNQPAVAANS
jgi:hypothetical protein